MAGAVGPAQSFKEGTGIISVHRRLGKWLGKRCRGGTGTDERLEKKGEIRGPLRSWTRVKQVKHSLQVQNLRQSPKLSKYEK